MIIWISETRVIIPVTSTWHVHDSDDFLYMLRDSVDAKTASEAAFIAESHHPSKYGLKIFYHKEIAQFAYTKQKQLSKQGLSPLVGHHGLIRVSVISRAQVCQGFGFLTEVVNQSRPVYWQDSINQTFFNKLKRIDADRDASGNNVGFDRRGRLVLCDTGTHSFYQGASRRKPTLC